jgi:DNA repair protein RecN (Recombination protein N)
MDQAFALIEEARHELDSLLARLEVKPGQLEKTDDRIHDLRAMARKYGGTTAGLPKLLSDFQAKLSLAQGDDGQLRKAERAAHDARETFLGLARALSAARKDAAKRLEKVVETELAPLKLGHAKFRVTLTALPESEANAFGLERVAFEVATVEGAAYGPLARIASGGELARFSLALKVALASAQPPAALVFDEVDRGVGGAVADAVGERLQRLAEGTQVLLVTHSPQVAARASRHFRISRLGDKTKVVLLTEDERLEEIARMLSGAAVTAEARAAAKRLLDEASQPRKQQKKRA